MSMRHDGDVAFFAAQFRTFTLGGGGDFASDVAAEQIAHSFALQQTATNALEPALQLAEFGRRRPPVNRSSPRSTRAAAPHAQSAPSVSQARIHR